MNEDKRLIEDYLPIEAISKAASSEKSTRKGHISTLHLWWARRPLVACRAAVYGVLVPASQFMPDNGPKPIIMECDTPEQESETVSQWLSDLTSQGLKPHEIGVFVRSASQLDRARVAVGDAIFPFKILDENVQTTSGHVSIGTMHLAKGLEFRAVVVMACDYEVIPLHERIEAVSADTDLEEVYNTERHLLYVACTRARDHLLVTSVNPASEFLDDLRI